MPLTTTQIETERLLGLNVHGNKSRAISRPYPGGCPHKEGDILVLAYEDPQTGRPKEYAKAKIMGVMPMSFEQRSANNEHTNKLAEAEGFMDASAWATYYRGIYGGTKGTVFYRFLLNVVVPDQEVTKVDVVPRARPGGAPPAQPAPKPAPQTEGETRTLGDVDDLEQFEREMFGSAG